MAKPCIICVASTGSLPCKADNSTVPISVAEQVGSTQEARSVRVSVKCRIRASRSVGTPNSWRRSSWVSS